MFECWNMQVPRSLSHVLVDCHLVLSLQEAYRKRNERLSVLPSPPSSLMSLLQWPRMSVKRKTLRTRSPSLPTNPSDAPTQNLDPSHFGNISTQETFLMTRMLKVRYVVDDFTTLYSTRRDSVLRSRNVQLSHSNVEDSVRAFSAVLSYFALKK